MAWPRIRAPTYATNGTVAAIDPDSGRELAYHVDFASQKDAHQVTGVGWWVALRRWVRADRVLQFSTLA